MNETNPREKIENLPMRHYRSVKAFADKKAREESIPPSVLYRLIFNAGLKARYGVDIIDNRIVEQPPVG